MASSFNKPRLIISSVAAGALAVLAPACFNKVYWFGLTGLFLLIINTQHIIAKIAPLIWLARIFVGLLFIISGLIKANDPLGFSYKLEEYFHVFQTGFMVPYALILSIIVVALEVILGITLLLGARICLTIWLLLLMIVFFTGLTFVSACYNKVTDCGCFGDAVKLTPWQSFWKDILLLILILILYAGRDKIKPLLGRKAENRVVLLASVLSFAFPLYTYSFLPVKDFRPYAVGNNIAELMRGTPDSLKFFYILRDKKTGEKKKFEAFPEDYDLHYDYDTAITEVLKKGIEPRIKNFFVMDADGNNKSEELLAEPAIFLLVAYDLQKTCKNVQPEINRFAAQSEKAGIPFIGLTATPATETDLFRHDVQAMYDFYFSDATELKTIIRSNPGLVLLKNGVVAGQWHYNSFPEFNKVNETLLKK